MMIQTENPIDITYRILPRSEWVSKKESHERKLSEILDPYLKNRSEQKKDPVLDFLFEYYKFRPSHLLRWSPGTGVALEAPEESDHAKLPAISELTLQNGFAVIDPMFFPDKRIRTVRWIHDLLIKTQQSKPFFGCFGMHEWAMVYRSDNVRHQQLPLRFPDDKIAKIVESRPVLCTHFDAYRFFTDAAKPLNKHSLSRETFQDTEQPGCIHSNMDLYKWAYKLYPWISSELIREAFFLALHARTIDMKASPYDLRDRGLKPIKIETEKGRRLYLQKQNKIWEMGKPVRQKLIEAYGSLLMQISS
jgi:hypothetical protein